MYNDLIRRMPLWVKWRRSQKKDGRAVRPGSKSDSELKGKQEKVGWKFPRLPYHLRKMRQGHRGVLGLARVSRQENLTSPRNGLTLISWPHTILGWSSSCKAQPQYQTYCGFQGAAFRPLVNYSTSVWRGVRCIFMATTSNFTMSWCPSQIHSWLLPARNSTTPASSWNVKEIVFEPLLSQRAGQLSVRIGNSASAPGQRGSVCWGCLCPVSLRKWNITTERFCGHSTQLWVFGAQERFMQSWRHNSIQGYPGEIVQKLSFDCNGPWNNLKERNGKKKRKKEGNSSEGKGKQLLSYKEHSHISQCWPITLRSRWR